jgi:hypothetical protein
MDDTSERSRSLASVVIDHDTETGQYLVVGVTKAGEFPISGPWASMEKAEGHAKLIISLFNESAAEIIAESKKRIILA